MAYLFDGILLLAAVIIIILCTHNGFIKSVLSFGKTILSLILAWIFGKYVASWFMGSALGNWIRDSIHQMFLNMYETGSETFDLSKAVESIPDTIKSVLEHLNVNLDEIADSFGSMTEANAAQLDEFSTSISEPIVTFVCSVVGYICVFFVALLVISILIRISDLVTSLPVIHFCNQTLGFLLGVVLALTVIILLSRIGAAILAAVTSANPKSQFAGVYEKTYIMRYLNSVLGYKP